MGKKSALFVNLVTDSRTSPVWGPRRVAGAARPLPPRKGSAMPKQGRRATTLLLLLLLIALPLFASGRGGGTTAPRSDSLWNEVVSGLRILLSPFLAAPHPEGSRPPRHVTPLCGASGMDPNGGCI